MGDMLSGLPDRFVRPWSWFVCQTALMDGEDGATPVRFGAPMSLPTFSPPRDLLTELEPVAERLLNRHLGMAREWFPHDYVPYSLGRDYDKEPWTPDQPRITGVAQIAFEVNLLTEDNLPSYHREIHRMFGRGDGQDQLGESLDRRGRPSRHRPARLPGGDAEHRPL